MNRLFTIMAVAMAWLLTATSCRESYDFSQQYTEPDYTEHDLEWWQMLGCIPDTAQIWVTAIRVNAYVYTSDSALVSVYSKGNETRTLYQRKLVCGDASLHFDVPQTDADSIAFECAYADGSKFRGVALTGDAVQDVYLDFSAQSTRAIAGVDNATHRQQLTGNSIIGSVGYSTFPGWIWQNIDQALPEKGDPTAGNNQVSNYELVSNGPFLISFLYGGTGNFRKRTLGYYYYKEAGQYSDLKMVYMTETLLYDYIDGYSKVQYQLDDIDQWIDANFDVFDYNKTIGMKCPIPGRNDAAKEPHRNDDVYNTLSLNAYYGSRVSAVRGITFRVDVPKGYRVGFFLEGDETNSNQRSKLLKLGFPADQLPATKYYTCFSFNAFNEGGKSYRSSIRRFDNYTFLGFEDSVAGGDQDCNDICFAIMAADGGLTPDVLLPGVYDVNKRQYYNEDATWSTVPKDFDPATNGPLDTDDDKDETGGTAKNKSNFMLAYEDMGQSGDFDFNDVVINVVPNTANRAKVYICAAGGSLNAELYYQGPNGDQYLGNVHKLMGGTMLNTGATITKQQVLAGTVDWPESYSATTDAYRFYVIAGNKRIAHTTQSGKTPDVICVTGNWQWAMENVNITDAYPMLGKWAQNVSDPSYWNWHQQPNKNLVVKKK